MTAPTQRRTISRSDLGSEPFRVFFPLAVLAGIAGVALWPLHFGHVVSLYPGQAHARIMTSGLLGGFIIGFLGTSMPRMLSALPLGFRNVTVLSLLHIAMVCSYWFEKIAWGDQLFAALILFLILLLGRRFALRKDIPPPGFVLVLLALGCALGAAGLGVYESYAVEPDPYWVMLRRLLLYQGFVLLPVLGIGPFLLPRFFSLKSLHDFPEMRTPNSAWIKKAALALCVGIVVVGSFFLELSGWFRTAYGLRFGATLFYMALEFPFRRAGRAQDALAISLWVASAMILIGFLMVALFPALRIALLHLTLVGGFAMIAFVVATRVVYGHSGNMDRLKSRKRWLVASLSLMLFAMGTRVSGDFWPAITISHYVYGALVWIISAGIWSAYVLPKVLQPDE